jgi:hypothetical protein
MKKICFSIFIILDAFANEVVNILEKLPENERTQKLGGLLNASDTPCVATISFFRGVDKDGAAYWSVACSNGKSYAIQVNNDSEGSSKIADCDVLKTAGVDCFTKFDQ